MKKVKGEHAWLFVLASVVGYEALAVDGELMSETIDKLLVTHPVLTRALIVVVAAHLINLLPQRFDPVHRLVDLKGLIKTLSAQEASVVREAEQILSNAAAGK